MAQAAFPSPAEIAEPLLAFLQAELGAGAYVEPPTAMTPGNDTQVHALRLTGVDEALVLRVFAKGSDPRRPLYEATLQNALADQGIPVPRARAICTDPAVLGAPFFVMERARGRALHGDTLSTDEAGLPRADWRRILVDGGAMLIDMPAFLAAACLRVHQADPAPVRAALEAAGLPWREITSVDGRIERLQRVVEESGVDGLRAGVAWLVENRPTPEPAWVVCHCDVQPLNLMVEDGVLTSILDWANCVFGPRELEIGWSRAVYATIDLPLPGPIRPFEGLIRGVLMRRLTRSYQRAQPLDRALVGYYEALRSIYALGSLADSVVRGEPIRDAWNSQAGVARLAAHVRRLTGVGVSIPWPGCEILPA